MLCGEVLLEHLSTVLGLPESALRSVSPQCARCRKVYSASLQCIWNLFPQLNSDLSAKSLKDFCVRAKGLKSKFDSGVKTFNQGRGSMSMFENF